MIGMFESSHGCHDKSGACTGAPEFYLLRLAGLPQADGQMPCNYAQLESDSNQSPLRGTVTRKDHAKNLSFS